MTQAKQTTNRTSEVTIATLSQEAATTALNTAATLRDASEKLTQEFIDTGLATHEASTRATREYLASLAKVRKEWIKKSDEVSEKAASLSPAEFEYPFKREIEEFNAGFVEGTRKTLDFFTAPLASTRR